MDTKMRLVIPIPATVIPVTRFHAYKKWAIDILKLRNPFKQGLPFQHKRQKQILEYNDWLRLYCQGNGFIVLDLEKAVRKNEKKRYLRSGLARLDGLHLNKKGYQALDQLVGPALRAASL
jgi:lysophospholipase L1-like esterase